MFEDWTDEELVDKILKSKGSPQDQYLTILFWRYFDKFEKNIRAVLRSHNIAYNDDESYFNYVFDGIYERLFGPQTFRKIAAKFNPIRSNNFRNWFLGKVKRDRIRDWLRSKNREKGITNRTYLILKYPVLPYEEYLHPPSEHGNPEKPHKGDPVREAGGYLITSIHQLPPLDRILIKLLYYGVSPFNDEEIEYLIERTGKNKKQILKSISEYEAFFEEHFEADLSRAQELDMSIGTQHFLHLQNQKKLHKKSEELEALFDKNIDTAAIRHKAENKTISELTAAIGQQKQAFQKGVLSPMEYRRQLAELEFMILAVRDRKLKAKIDTLNKQLERLFNPVNQAAREFLGMEQKAFFYYKQAALTKVKKTMEGAG